MSLKWLSTLFYVLFSVQSFAVCLTIEQADQLGCNIAYEEELINQCLNDFGPEFIAYHESSQCTKEKAFELRGGISPDQLLTGLRSRIDEIDVFLSLLDPNSKDLLSQTLEPSYFDYQLYHKSFNSDQLKIVYQRLRELRDLLKNRSYKSFKLNSKAGAEFVKYTFSYLALRDRLYISLLNFHHHYDANKVKEHFSYIDDLNLKLNKVIGLELLSKVHLASKHSQLNEIEFFLGREQKKHYEESVLRQIKDKKDYAKLIQFSALDEALVNRWGASRMSLKPLAGESIKSCTLDYKIYNSSSDFIKTNPAYQELVKQDRYGLYASRLDELTVKNAQETILTQERLELLFNEIMAQTPKILYELKDYNKLSDSEIENWSLEQSEIIYNLLNDQWINDVASYTKTSTLIGDQLSLKAIAASMTRMTYDHIKDLLTNNILFTFAYLGLNANELMSVKSIIHNSIKDDYQNWYQKIYNNLSSVYPELVEDQLSLAMRTQNKKDKIEETYQLAQSFMDAYLYKLKHEKKMNITNANLIRNLKPTEPLELMVLKQNSIRYDKELMKLLAEDESFNESFEEFKLKIEQDYINEVQKLKKEDFSKEKLIKILAEITFNNAFKFYEKYPSDFVSSIKDYISNWNLEELSEKGVNLDKLKKGIEKERFSIVRDNTNIIANRSYKVLTQPKKIEKDKDACEQSQEDKWFTWSNIKLAMMSSGFHLPGLSHYAIVPQTKAVSSERSIGKEQIKKIEQEQNKALMNIESSEDMVRNITPQEGVLRILKIFDLELPVLEKLSGQKYKVNLALSKQDKLSLANYRLGKVKEATMMLDVPLKSIAIKRVPTKNGVREVKEEVFHPLFERLAKIYDQKNQKLPKEKAIGLINQAHQEVIKSNVDKFQIFCQARALSYKNNDQFRLLYRSIPHLRNNLKASLQTTEKCTTVSNLDTEIEEEIKTTGEVLREKVDKSFAYIGIGLIVVTGVLMGLSTFGIGGAALPSLMFWMMTLDAVVFMPASLLSVGLGYNIHYIEQPKTLAFQRSLINSQIDKEFFATNQDFEEAKKAMKNSQLMIAGEIGLNALFLGLTAQGVKMTLGMRGAKILKKANIPVRGFGARPKSKIELIESYKISRKKYNLKKPVGKKAGRSSVNRLLDYTPKYQPYTKQELAEFIRILFVKKGEELGVENTPWIIKEDLDNYLKGITKRFSEYQTIEKDIGIIFKYKDNSKIKVSEIFKKWNYTQVSFVPRSFFRALVKDGIKGARNYFKDFDQVLLELSNLRGKLLKDRADKVQNLILKLDEVQKLAQLDKNFYQKYKANHALDYYQSTLNLEEMALLGEISRAQNKWYRPGATKLGEFKTAFKDHKKVIDELETFRFDDGREFDPNLTYTNRFIDQPNEDLKVFYQDMIIEDGSVTTLNTVKMLRKKIEHRLR